MTQMPPIAVLAGGLATRLRPLTEKIPKSMLEVAGAPFVAHQLGLFRREGIVRVVFCTGFLGEMLEAFVGDGSRFGLEVSYSRDGDRLLGTGGAIRKALPLLGHRFMVTYGDSYLDIVYRPVVEAFERAQKPALMTVLRNEGRWDTSNVEFVDERIVQYSKKATPDMHHIDFGLSVLRDDVVGNVPVGEAFDLARVYARLVELGEMTGYEVHRRFFEIGSRSGLAETDAYLREQLRRSY